MVLVRRVLLNPSGLFSIVAYQYLTTRERYNGVFNYAIFGHIVFTN